MATSNVAPEPRINPIVQEVLKRESFHKLEPSKQIDFLRQIDPDGFAKINPRTQGEIVNNARETFAPFPTEPQEDYGGVGQQALRAVKRFGSNLVAPFTQNPLTSAKQAFQGTVDTVQKTKDQYQQALKNPTPANIAGTLGYGAAAALPFAGPMLASSGEALGKGDYGTAAGDAATILASPKIGSAIGSVLKSAPAFIPAAVRGGMEAAKEPISFKGMTGAGSIPSLIGGYLGYKAGHYPGAVVGAGLGEVVRKVGSGAIEAGKKAVEDNKPAVKVSRAIDYKQPVAEPEPEARSGGGSYNPRLAKGSVVRPRPEPDAEARSSGGTLKVYRPSKTEVEKFGEKEDPDGGEDSPEEVKSDSSEPESSSSPEPEGKAVHPLTQKMNEVLDALKNKNPDLYPDEPPPVDDLLDKLRESVKLVKKQRAEKNN